MPSVALTHWQTDRMVRHGLVDSHCAALMASTALSVPSASASLPPLAEKSLGAYVMLISGHFQGFCRDLYTECIQGIISALPTRFKDAVQTQFNAETKLNTGNPTIENIRKDFERFGITLDLTRLAAANSPRVTHLGHLNYWRNAVAHQKTTPPPAGVPGVLTLANIQNWRAACDGLATSLDVILHQEMSQILGVVPW